jgi:hypothetical protein
MDEKANGDEIDRAFTAVQRHVLPGLMDAWDQAGPSVVIVLTGMLADVWLSEGCKTAAMVEMIYAIERRVSGLALVK